MKHQFPIHVQVYIRNRDKTLFLHRTKKENDPLHDKWIAVGGKMEQGESPEDCAKREVKEETDLDVVNLRMRGVIIFIAKDADDDLRTSCAFIFETSDFKGEMMESPEGDLAWVRNDKVFDLNIFDKDELFLPWILDSNKFFSAKFFSVNGKLESHDVNFYD